MGGARHDKVGKKDRAKGRLGESKLQQYSSTDCINNYGYM
jgi:hypothetical protein